MMLLPDYKIKAGKYRHRITIKNPPTDDSRDSTGARIGTGTTVATVWAEKQDWAGDESRSNSQETAIKLTKFKTRYRTDILSKMTVTHGTDVYDIETVLDFDGTKREITLECRKQE